MRIPKEKNSGGGEVFSCGVWDKMPCQCVENGDATLQVIQIAKILHFPIENGLKNSLNLACLIGGGQVHETSFGIESC